MNTSNRSIERMYRAGEQRKGKKRQIMVPFSFYKYEINILWNYRKPRETKNPIFEDFSQEIMQIGKGKGKEVLTSRKQDKI